MKVKRKLKGTPSGCSLNISLLYGIGDIKTALIQIKKKIGQNESISMKNLVQMLCDTATDSHMKEKPRRYIAEWMARRAVVEGFVFRMNAYLGKASTGTDLYLIDDKSIREKMRGRKPKVKQ